MSSRASSIGSAVDDGSTETLDVLPMLPSLSTGRAVVRGLPWRASLERPWEIRRQVAQVSVDVPFLIKHITGAGIDRVFRMERVEPVRFGSFVSLLSGREKCLPVRMQGQVVEAGDLPLGADTTFEMTLEFTESVRHFVLVNGGVLPPQLIVGAGTRLLLDRNILSTLRALPGGAIAATGPLAWLNSEELHLNALLAALEGAHRRAPTRKEFCGEYQQLVELLAGRLPRAKLVEFSQKNLDVMHEMAVAFADRAQREARFLRSVATRVADPVGRQALRRTEDWILQEADRSGLKRLSAVVLVVLAKLYEGETDRPAARLLKLYEIRSAGDGWEQVAYNAVADVRQLELASAGATMPGPVGLVTGDRGLAQVWSGLRPTGDADGRGQVLFRFEPDPELFPRLEGGLDELLGRITASVAPSRPLSPTGVVQEATVQEHLASPDVVRTDPAANMSDPLPTFERPPLIETVLGVQFAPIKGLSTAHLGLFWGRLGEGWRQAGEADAVGQVLTEEQMPGARLGEAMIVHGRARRLRFLDASRSRMLQVENGWFVHNWRRTAEAEPYPRFAVLLPEFLGLLAKWRQFLAEQQLGGPVANLWEVSYVNAIEKGSMWQTPNDWANLLPALLAAPRLGTFGMPTTGALRWQFDLPGSAGYLEVTLDHVLESGRGSEALRVMQTARGRISDSSAIEAGLRAGRDAIVRTFEAMSSEAAQRHWGRI